ncbi:MAG: HNH endonuclease [Deltaproteobacteria bacterium]|nr:HNH endonuclease [Deltaproteobacteria bacterium]
MQRLNVRQSQIRECIEKSMFAVDRLPSNPPLHNGEILLLQLVKQEAIFLGKLHSRIEFALLFDHYEIDHTGEISRYHWPLAGKTWKYILFCSRTIPTVPFSLEDLPLSFDYAGQANPRAINPADESSMLSYIWGEVSGYTLRDNFGPTLVREAVANYDATVIRKKPFKILIPEHEEFYRDQLLAESLKSIYDHRCQICGMNFRIKYDAPFAETHHIRPLSEHGLDIGENIIVICPNHHRIVHKTKPRFDRSKLLYRYPNGLEERLILTNHLEQTSFWR